MGVMSLLFEGALATLIVVLIVYCMKLNRRLVAFRSDDKQINELIARLIEASDRAEASVARLKSVGMAQERALRAAIGAAESARARLVPDTGERPSAPAPAIADALESAPRPSLATGGDTAPQTAAGQRADANAGAVAAPAPEPSKTRSEAERALIAAIRQARATG